MVSSIKYNNFKEGKAIKINIIAGMMVQTISITVPSTKNLYLYLEAIDLAINHTTKTDITGTTNIT
jgi:hypothetical protein